MNTTMTVAVAGVHLATAPNQLHFPQASTVLRAGKHLLCEKPLAVTSEQSSQLVQQAKQSGCVAGVAYNVRFYPLCHEAAARVQQQDFGRHTGGY